MIEETVSRIENLEDRLERLESKIEAYFSPDPRRKWVVGILTTIALGWAAWISGMIVQDNVTMGKIMPLINKIESMEHRTQLIENTRFTASDGVKQYQAVLEHGALPFHNGTSTILERMDKRLERIENRLDQIGR